MQFTHEIEQMCCVKKGCNHGPAPIPQEGNWTQSREITDISGLTHGVGWCAPQQGTCKLTLNVKNGIIEEALVETSGCSGMTHSAAMAAEWVMPEQPLVSTSASSMMPFLTFSVSLQVPCWGAHQPTPWVRPEISVISLDCVQLPSCGIGAGPWLQPFLTQHICSISCVNCMVLGC